ncbi:hypothetical protein JCM3770_003824 [Rhodotorula araucariae]
MRATFCTTSGRLDNDSDDELALVLDRARKLVEDECHGSPFAKFILDPQSCSIADVLAVPEPAMPDGMIESLGVGPTQELLLSLAQAGMLASDDESGSLSASDMDDDDDDDDVFQPHLASGRISVEAQ